MYYINLNEGGHVWEKQNLVTVFDGQKTYDIYKCKGCGISGNTTTLSAIAISERYSKEKVFSCPGRKKIEIPKVIKIIECHAFGKSFNNLIPGSEHNVIDAPEGYKNDHSGGVWVMGVDEPVKVIKNEYIKVK